jgi:hypothetical protein
MAVELRYSRRDEYPRISRFLDEFWAKNHVYCRDQPLFDWTFARSTHWRDDQYSFALAEEKDQLVGILGGIPFTFNDRGTTSNAVWIANYVVHPDFRKGSTALQLLSMFRRPEFQPLIAFGINPATATIYRVLRGQVLPEIPRHFMVLPGREDRMVNLLRTAYPDWETDRAAALAAQFTLPSAPEGADFGDSLPETWDSIDWNAMSQVMVGAARDADYLTWRYRKHPNFQYRFIAIKEGDRHGLAVWRLETIRKQTESGREDLDRIGRLVEFLPVSEANARSLFGSFVSELKRLDAFAADFYGFHGAVRCQLRALGFPEAAGQPDAKVVPTRFQPLDGKGGGILSAMFVQPEVPPCSLAADCPWYWTKSDSDQDRPN